MSLISVEVPGCSSSSSLNTESTWLKENIETFQTRGNVFIMKTMINTYKVIIWWPKKCTLFYLICSLIHARCLRRTCNKGSSSKSFSSESKKTKRKVLIKHYEWCELFMQQTCTELTFSLLQQLCNDFHGVLFIVCRTWGLWRHWWWASRRTRQDGRSLCRRGRNRWRK